MAATVGMNGEVSLWSLPDFKRLGTSLMGDPLTAYNCCFVPPSSSSAAVLSFSSNTESSSLSSASELPLILTGSQSDGVQVIKAVREETIDIMGDNDDSTDMNVLASAVTHLEKIASINDKNTIQLQLSSNFIMSIAASPDGTRGAAGHADGSVTVFDLHTASVITTFHAHQMGVRSLTFSYDGKELYTGSDDARIGIFDLSASLSSSLHSSASQKHHSHSHQRHSSSSSSSSYTIPLITPLTGHHGFVTKVATGPIDKSHILFSSSADKTVKIWDTRKRGCLHTFEGHVGTVWGVDYIVADTKKGGNRLASVSEMGTLIVHELNNII